jgi:ATP-binding cassette, subfamily G (WHITE), member 1
LKRLAQEGRTIICTIHSPSPYLFEIFDLVYTLAQGQVIYQGSSQNLVPFLRQLDLPCPKFYSPSDFLLEIATNDYGNQNPKLTEKIRNGSSSDFRRQIPLQVSIDNNNTNQSNEKLSSSDNGDFEYSTSFLQQFYYLLIRSFLTCLRDKTMFIMRTAISFVVSLCFSIMYSGIGNDASFIFDNQKYIVFSIFHAMFFGFNSQLSACK